MSPPETDEYRQPLDDESGGPGNEEIGLKPATSGKALTGLLLGVVALVLWAFTYYPPVIVWLLTVVLAGLCDRDIRRSRGRLKGRTLALAGVAVGMLGFLVVLPIGENVRDSIHLIGVS
jgi:hypothetical protein